MKVSRDVMERLRALDPSVLGVGVNPEALRSSLGLTPLDPGGPLRLVLPWPPSANSYWRHTARGVFLTKEAKAYHARVKARCLGVAPLIGWLEVCLLVHPPDRRRRDLDNVVPLLLDSLTRAGVYGDDYQIARLLVERGRVDDSKQPEPGLVFASLRPLTGPELRF